MELWRDELYHHGIKGQKWGVRRFQNEDGSLTTAGRKRYGLNERLHLNRADKLQKRADVARTMASMNKAAGGKGIYGVNDRYYNKRADKLQTKANIQRNLASYKNVDSAKAKNSATRRVAEDYNRLTDAEFRAKYKTTKNVFAKRYAKTDGDTYTLGRKRRARAIAFLPRMQGKTMARTMADVAKYDALSQAEQKALDHGKEFTAKMINYGAGVSMLNQYSNTWMPKKRN